MRRPMILGTAFALALVGLGALPGQEAWANVTGTGGGPETTANAPYRSATGQTVPPGQAQAPLADPAERTQNQKNLDDVLGSVCRGC